MSPKLGTSWARIRARILDRDDYRCVRCGRRGDLEVDHIIGREHGRDDSAENLQTLCRGCHIQKTRDERGRNAVLGQSDWERELGA